MSNSQNEALLYRMQQLELDNEIGTASDLQGKSSSSSSLQNFIKNNAQNIAYNRSAAVSRGSTGPSIYNQQVQYLPPQYQQYSGVYENVDYVTTHRPPSVSDLDSKKFESNNAKAQPQLKQQQMMNPAHYAQGIMDNGSRYAHTPQPDLESSPIYENLQLVSGQQAQPQASAASKSIYYERSGSNSPQVPSYHNKDMNSDSLVLNPNGSKYININNGSYHQATSSLPNSMHQRGMPTRAQVDMNPQYVQLNTPINLPNSAGAQQASPARSMTKHYAHASPTRAVSRPYTEEINGSDYVCMSGGTLTKKLQQVKLQQHLPLAPLQAQIILPPKNQLQPSMATAVSVIHSIANDTQPQYTSPPSVEPKTASVNAINLNSLSQNSPAISPTPSQASSSGSGKSKESFL